MKFWMWFSLSRLVSGRCSRPGTTGYLRAPPRYNKALLNPNLRRRPAPRAPRPAPRAPDTHRASPSCRQAVGDGSRSSPSSSTHAVPRLRFSPAARAPSAPNSVLRRTGSALPVRGKRVKRLRPVPAQPARRPAPSAQRARRTRRAGQRGRRRALLHALGAQGGGLGAEFRVQRRHQRLRPPSAAQRPRRRRAGRRGRGRAGRRALALARSASSPCAHSAARWRAKPVRTCPAPARPAHASRAGPRQNRAERSQLGAGQGNARLVAPLVALKD
jgi:hypothetical protein